MKRKDLVFTWMHIIFPVLLGGVVYLLGRAHTFIAFKWLDLLLAGPVMESINMIPKPPAHAHILPEWIIYSLPDGLWAYSLTVTMLLIWKDGPLYLRIPGIALGPFVAIGYEVGQYFGWTPGTFCYTDLSLSGLAVFLAFILFHKQHVGTRKPIPDKRYCHREERSDVAISK